MRSRKGGQLCALRCRKPHLWQRMCYEVMSYHALAKGRAAVRAAVPQTAFVAGDERVRGRTPDNVVALALGKHGEHFVRCGKILLMCDDFPAGSDEVYILRNFACILPQLLFAYGTRPAQVRRAVDSFNQGKWEDL